jgi:O-antigen/teichoic acid export membrane protein
MWMLLLRFFNRGVGLISTLILVRLLLPEDFGLIAIATALVALVAILGEMSVNVVLVQKKEIDALDLNSAWSLRLVVGVITASALAGLAVPMSAFYSEPRLEFVVYALAAGVLIDGFSNIGPVFFQRELKFDLDFLLMAGQKLASVVVAVTLAFVFRSYWAMVAGILAGRLAHLALSYSLHSYRPRWSRERWNEIFRFSRWLLLNNGLFFLSNRLSDFVLGKLSGPKEVGIFSVAYELAMLPTTDLVAAINRAVLPGYSRMRSDPRVLQQSFLDVGAIIALLALPAALGIGGIAEVLVPVLFGSAWEALIPLIAVLAFAGAITSLWTNSGLAFLALGRPHMITVLTLIRLGLLVPGAIYAAMLHGALGVAIVYVATAAMMLPMYIGSVLKALEIPVMRYLSSIYRPLLSAIGMYLILDRVLVPWFEAKMFAPVALAASIVSGAFCFVSTELLLWMLARRPDGAERIALTFLRNRFVRS